MSELLSMVVPLDTLSGWPVVPDPTALQTVGLLIGFPALVFAIVYGIAYIGNAAKAKRTPTAEVGDPLWVGGRARGELEASGPAQAGDGDSNPVGGAGARW